METTECLRVDYSLREAFTVIQLRCEELLRAGELTRPERRTLALTLGECRRLSHAVLEVVERQVISDDEPADPLPEGW